MNRYKKTEIKLDKDGKRVYGTTYYPTIPIENTDKFIITTLDNRLDSLANQYYGDVSLWWVIAKANGIKGKTVGYTEDSNAGEAEIGKDHPVGKGEGSKLSGESVMTYNKNC